MKILRVDGSKKTFQHNPISPIVVVQFTNTFVFLEFFILCSVSLSYHDLGIRHNRLKPVESDFIPLFLIGGSHPPTLVLIVFRHSYSYQLVV